VQGNWLSIYNYSLPRSAANYNAKRVSQHLHVKFCFELFCIFYPAFEVILLTPPSTLIISFITLKLLLLLLLLLLSSLFTAIEFPLGGSSHTSNK
jgi:hypothetical protein